MNQTIKDRLYEILTQESGILARDIWESNSFQDDIGFDALDLENIRLEVEIEFEIKLSEEEMIASEKVADLLRLLRSKLSEVAS